MVETGPARRKLAAILAADVVGYSLLTGADEEGTLARLKALRAELVDPSIAERAQPTTRRIDWRIGVNHPAAGAKPRSLRAHGGRLPQGRSARLSVDT